jgi:hypothetical protein
MHSPAKLSPLRPRKDVDGDAEESDDLADGELPAVGSDEAATHRSPRRSFDARSVVGPVLLGLLAIPLVVAVVVLRQPRWYPLLDIAQTELRVRDVWSSHPPLIGLAGRIGTVGADQGSHPGPLAFWVLSPLYQVFGGDAWALKAATAALNVIAMGSLLWLALRRGGVALALGVGATTAVMTHAFGAAALTEAWLPYLPMVWWVVFLFSVWSLLCGDLPVLPLAVFAGSLCVQTHISYAVLVAGLGALGFVAVLHRLIAQRGDPEGRHRSIRWALIGGGTAAVLWLPPVIDQLTNRPGNLSRIYDHFSDPPEEYLGAAKGFERLLIHLNPWTLLTEEVGANRFIVGSTLPGLVLLAAWAISVVAAWRLRQGALLRLHGLAAAALALAAVSMSRISGPAWYYLTLWGWGITAVLIVALGWTVCAMLNRTVDGPRRQRLGVAGAVGVLGVVVLSTLSFAVDAADTDVAHPQLSATMAVLVPQTLEGLDDPDTPGDRRGPYLVTWADPAFLGSRGFALFNELDRHGVEVGAGEYWQAAVTTARVIEVEEATAEVHLAVGPDIAKWQNRPDVRRVAYVDPATPEERAEYERLRLLVIDELRSQGRPELLRSVDENPFLLGSDTRLSPTLRDRVRRMTSYGQPVAVFVAPIDPPA